MIHFALFMVIMASIPMSNSPSYDVVVPVVSFKYDTDEWNLNQQVKIDIDPKSLYAVLGAQARLFSSLYVADPDDPAQIAINRKGSHCKIFNARPVPFSPDTESPFVLVGSLQNSDLRCTHGSLASTVCYLVITKDKMGNQIKLDPNDIDSYFAYAYRFTVNVPPGRKCSKGTEATDLADEEQRRTDPAAFAREKRASEEQQNQLAKIDGPKACVKIKQ
jgi:hypothetical protein